MLALVVAITCSLSSPELGHFFDRSNESNSLPESVSSERTYGSPDCWTNSTHRIDYAALGAVNALFEGWCERCYYFNEGESNAWEEVDYGPTCRDFGKEDEKWDFLFAMPTNQTIVAYTNITRRSSGELYTNIVVSTNSRPHPAFIYYDPDRYYTITNFEVMVTNVVVSEDETVTNVTKVKRWLRPYTGVPEGLDTNRVSFTHRFVEYPNIDELAKTLSAPEVDVSAATRVYRPNWPWQIFDIPYVSLWCSPSPRVSSTIFDSLEFEGAYAGLTSMLPEFGWCEFGDMPLTSNEWHLVTLGWHNTRPTTNGFNWTDGAAGDEIQTKMMKYLTWHETETIRQPEWLPPYFGHDVMISNTTEEVISYPYGWHEWTAKVKKPLHLSLSDEVEVDQFWKVNYMEALLMYGVLNNGDWSSAFVDQIIDQLLPFADEWGYADADGVVLISFEGRGVYPSGGDFWTGHPNWETTTSPSLANVTIYDPTGGVISASVPRSPDWDMFERDLVAYKECPVEPYPDFEWSYDDCEAVSQSDPDESGQVIRIGFNFTINCTGMGTGWPMPYNYWFLDDKNGDGMLHYANLSWTAKMSNDVSKVRGMYTNDTRRLVTDRVAGISQCLGALDRTYCESYRCADVERTNAHCTASTVLISQPAEDIRVYWELDYDGLHGFAAENDLVVSGFEAVSNDDYSVWYTCETNTLVGDRSEYELYCSETSSSVSTNKEHVATDLGLNSSWFGVSEDAIRALVDSGWDNYEFRINWWAEHNSQDLIMHSSTYSSEYGEIPFIVQIYSPPTKVTLFGVLSASRHYSWSSDYVPLQSALYAGVRHPGSFDRVATAKLWSFSSVCTASAAEPFYSYLLTDAIPSILWQYFKYDDLDGSVLYNSAVDDYSSNEEFDYAFYRNYSAMANKCEQELADLTGFEDFRNPTNVIPLADAPAALAGCRLILGRGNKTAQFAGFREIGTFGYTSTDHTGWYNPSNHEFAVVGNPFSIRITNGNIEYSYFDASNPNETSWVYVSIDDLPASARNINLATVGFSCNGDGDFYPVGSTPSISFDETTAARAHGKMATVSRVDWDFNALKRDDKKGENNQ